MKLFAINFNLIFLLIGLKLGVTHGIETELATGNEYHEYKHKICFIKS